MMRAWTLKDIRDANAMTAEQWAVFHSPGTVGNVPLNHVPAGSVAAEPWTWIIFVQRLCWAYGEDGALARLNERRAAA